MPCTREYFASAGACYQLLNQNRQRLAFRVWLHILMLAENGGTDYTADIKSLNEAAKCLNIENGEQRQVADIVIDAQNATATGATVPTDITDVMEDIACLQYYTDQQLDSMLRLLRCELGPPAPL